MASSHILRYGGGVSGCILSQDKFVNGNTHMHIHTKSMEILLLIIIIIITHTRQHKHKVLERLDMHWTPGQIWVWGHLSGGRYTCHPWLLQCSSKNRIWSQLAQVLPHSGDVFVYGHAHNIDYCGVTHGGRQPPPNGPGEV